MEEAPSAEEQVQDRYRHHLERMCDFMYDERQSAPVLAVIGREEESWKLPLKIIEKSLIPYNKIRQIKYDPNVASHYWTTASLAASTVEDDDNNAEEEGDTRRYQRFLQGLGVVGSFADRNTRYCELVARAEEQGILLCGDVELKQGGTWSKKWLALLANIWLYSLKLSLQLGQKEWDLDWVSPDPYGDDYYAYHSESSDEESGNETEDEDDRHDRVKRKVERAMNDVLVFVNPEADNEALQFILDMQKQKSEMKKIRNAMPSYTSGNMPIAHGINCGWSDDTTWFQTPMDNLAKIARFLSMFACMVPKNRRQLLLLYSSIQSIPENPRSFEDTVDIVMWNGSREGVTAAPELYMAAPAFMLAVTEFVRTRYWSRCNPRVSAVDAPPRRRRRQTHAAGHEAKTVQVAE
jgi:hypothetical protein